MGRLIVFASRYSGMAELPRMPAADIGSLVNGVLRFIAKCRMGCGLRPRGVLTGF